jgi:phosphotransacetylase/acyl dehydratase
MSFKNPDIPKDIPTHNTPWDQLQVGQAATLKRRCTPEDLLLFAHASGNVNPATLPALESGMDAGPAMAPSMWVASLVSAVLGNVLPGPGTMYRNQSLGFSRRVFVGDELTVCVTCLAKADAPLAVFETRITNQAGDVVCEGQAEVEAPTTLQAIERRQLPALILGHKDHFSELIVRAQRLPALTTAVVCPEDANSMGGVVLSVQQGLIEPVLLGHPGRIRQAAEALGADISAWRLVPAAEPHQAASLAVAMARAGEVGALMKGAIHSDELLGAVVHKELGLRTRVRLSHVFVMDAPTLDHLLFISDAAINIAPDLSAKVDIVQNAIDVARACGLEKPRVGILSAVENINLHIPSTLDAAVLCKMAERGQIRGGTLDGPLAMDNAIDLDAARTKGIESSVAGRAEVLIVPNLEAGNMLAKELTFVSRAEAAGLVVGARVPVILTSRADNDRARLASCALALLHADWQRQQQAPALPVPVELAQE